MTLDDLIGYINENVPEVDFLELLDISTEDLTIAFEYKIEHRFEDLLRQLGLEDNGEEGWEGEDA